VRAVCNGRLDGIDHMLCGLLATCDGCSVEVEGE
jgi:hypothetical protein